MVTTVSVRDAKTHLSSLLREVEAGAEITIARAGRPVARLTRYVAPRRELGTERGQIWIAPDFDDPLPDELLGDFER